MDSEDRITAEGAVTGSDVTVSNNVQALHATKTSINEARKASMSKKSNNARPNEGAVTRVEYFKEDAMSKTTTQVGHLRLEGESDPGLSTFLIREGASRHNEKSHVVANSRRPCDISLSINIHVIRSKTSLPAFRITVPASKCTHWNELRGEVIAASWQNARVNNLRKVHFRLEEDGKAASLTIAPTRIDAQTAFPGKIYEGWYHRILRGKQPLYKVDVNIEI